jgi:uncharacterized protein (DUF1330 family)
MQTTRRDVLAVGGAGFGAATHLFAVEQTGNGSDQPGDTVSEAERRERFVELMKRFGDDPVDMLNLLKFKTGGEASYRRYGAGFMKLIATHAPDTRVVYQADCAELLTGNQEWDHLIIVRYPSVKAFLTVVGSSGYADIADLRLDALERAVLYAMVPSGS